MDGGLAVSDCAVGWQMTDEVVNRIVSEVAAEVVVLARVLCPDTGFVDARKDWEDPGCH